MFRGLVMVSSGLGFGGVVGSLTLLQDGPYGFEFHWSSWAIPGFFLGAVVSTIYWWFVFHFSARSALGAGRRTIYALSGVLLFLSLLAFLYPVRFIPAAKRGDVIIGLTAAIVVLGTIGYLIRTIVRWLEQDTAEAEDDPPEDPPGA